MLDAGRLVALIFAASASVRARYVLGLVVIAALLLLDVPWIVLPIAHRRDAPPNAFFAFALLLWGPSSLPAPVTRWTLASLVGAHPALRTASSAALAWVPAIAAFRRARPLRPESEEARRWDRIGLRFLLVAILDALVFVSWVLVRGLVGE